MIGKVFIETAFVGMCASAHTSPPKYALIAIPRKSTARSERGRLMKTDRSQSRIGAAFLVFSMLFGIGIALSLTAQAQNPDDRYTQDRNRRDNADQNRRGRDWDRYGNYGGSSELRRTALNA